MATKLLKRLVPTPLRRPVRGAVLFLIPSLRRRLTRAWRRRNRPRRHVRGARDRLNRLWRKQLKPAWLHTRLLLWYWRRRNRPAEPSNQIHLINPLLSYTGAPLRTLHLFDELKNHAEVQLWSEHKVPREIAEK